MSLESELVRRLINGGTSVPDVIATINDLNKDSRTNFQLDNKKVNDAIKKYDLLNRYDPKRSNFRNRVKRYILEKSEAIKEEPEVLSLKTNIGKVLNHENSSFDCADCDHPVYRAYADIIYLKQLGKGEVIRQFSQKDLFYFCKSCEVISEQIKKEYPKIWLISPC